MFQLSCPNWNSSLSREELEHHLAAGSGKIVTSEAAQPTRCFIRALLQGRGILAKCIIARTRQEPSPAPSLPGAANPPQPDGQSMGAAATVALATTLADAVSTSAVESSSATVAPLLLNTGAGTELDVALPADQQAMLEQAMARAVPFAFHIPPLTYAAENGPAQAQTAATLALQPAATLQAFAHISTLSDAPIEKAATISPAISAPIHAAAASADTVYSDTAAPAAPAAGPTIAAGKPSAARRGAGLSTATKPSTVSDSDLPLLQIVTVADVSAGGTELPILIPRPQLDESALILKSLYGPKGRVRAQSAGGFAAAAAGASVTAVAGHTAAAVDASARQDGPDAERTDTGVTSTLASGRVADDSTSATIPLVPTISSVASLPAVPLPPATMPLHASAAEGELAQQPQQAPQPQQALSEPLHTQHPFALIPSQAALLQHHLQLDAQHRVRADL